MYTSFMQNSRHSISEMQMSSMTIRLTIECHAHRENHPRQIMKSYVMRAIVPLLCFAMLFFSCHEESSPRISSQTIIVLMPWSDNLKPFFDNNIDDMAEAIAEGILADERVVACVATSPQKALFIELRGEGGVCKRDTLHVFSDINFTASSCLVQLLAFVERNATAHHYAMIVGGHGMAWLPTGSMPARSPRRQPETQPMTRWIGGFANDTQIEISTLADGIRLSGLHMDYILFDDCYMSSVEVVYELRDVTDYVVGCPTEIMAYGFPYHHCLRHLKGNVNYLQLCEAFYSFYSQYKIPCGAISVTDCGQLDALAEAARAINSRAEEIGPKGDIQATDGFNPPLFYDLGDTFRHLCTDTILLGIFMKQLEKAVPFKTSTDYYFSSYGGYQKINHFSGLNTSQSSINPVASSWIFTKWYQDTH